MMAKRLSKHANVCTNGNPDPITSRKAIIHINKISYDDRKIIKFEHRDGSEGKPSFVVLQFEDGTSKNEGFIVSRPRAGIASQLGLEMTPGGHIKVSPPFNETSFPGCVAAGDAGAPPPMHEVVHAAQMEILLQLHWWLSCRGSEMKRTSCKAQQSCRSEDLGSWKWADGFELYLSLYSHYPRYTSGQQELAQFAYYYKEQLSGIYMKHTG